METDQKAELEAKIKAKLKTIVEDIATYKQLTKPISPDNAIGRLTRMEAINSKGINEAALNKAENTKFKLERALTKIDDPDFGYCRECDELIPPARLLIMPETDLCVQCAEIVGG
jgi:RNA polymerase-binding transcription factor